MAVAIPGRFRCWIGASCPLVLWFVLVGAGSFARGGVEADPFEIPPPPAAEVPPEEANSRTRELWQDEPLFNLKASINLNERLSESEVVGLNKAARQLAAHGTVMSRFGESRPWMLNSYEWEAPATRHLPLYFEEPSLERLGYAHCSQGWQYPESGGIVGSCPVDNCNCLACQLRRPYIMHELSPDCGCFSCRCRSSWFSQTVNAHLPDLSHVDNCDCLACRFRRPYIMHELSPDCGCFSCRCRSSWFSQTINPYLPDESYVAHCLQPVVSGLDFFLRVPVLPYMCGLQCPLEPVYTLGVDRPGSPVPYRGHRIPLSLKGAMYQAAFVLGLAYAIP